MNIVALLGSPHGLRGNTGGLLRHVLSAAESAGARTEIVVLKGDSVLPCLGCDACHKKGRCIQKDDFEQLKKILMKADALVLASPNYIWNVSAQMKAFMDRCCGVVHCMQFWGKYGASVVTSGGGDDESVTDYMNHFLLTTGIIPVGAVSTAMSSMPEGGFTEEVMEDARSLGKELVKAWKSQHVDDEMNRRRTDFRQQMLQLISYRKEEWPYEYGYWKERTGV
jgi:multimeric flavodoxin WrbA